MPPKGWRKHPQKKSRIPKIPVVGGKALRGRPRKDLMPPVQHKAQAAEAALTPEQRAERAVKAASAVYLAKIRHYAGRGMPPKYIASLLNEDFPEVPDTTTADDFEPGGRYYSVVVHGKALAAMDIGEGIFERAKNPTGKSIEALFWLKCNADWSETAAGREKAKKADNDDTLTGFDLVVVK